MSKKLLSDITQWFDLDASKDAFKKHGTTYVGISAVELLRCLAFESDTFKPTPSKRDNNDDLGRCQRMLEKIPSLATHRTFDMLQQFDKDLSDRLAGDFLFLFVVHEHDLGEDDTHDDFFEECKAFIHQQDGDTNMLVTLPPPPTNIGNGKQPKIRVVHDRYDFCTSDIVDFLCMLLFQTSYFFNNRIGNIDLPVLMAIQKHIPSLAKHAHVMEKIYHELSNNIVPSRYYSEDYLLKLLPSVKQLHEDMITLQTIETEPVFFVTNKDNTR